MTENPTVIFFKYVRIQFSMVRYVVMTLRCHYGNVGGLNSVNYIKSEKYFIKAESLKAICFFFSFGSVQDFRKKNGKQLKFSLPD